ncbi:MAG: chemotaxis protein [Deltaproteobacteria bacterium]|jgi:two-component system chemotaxis response regulator CheV|nr:chemotaxis protein [Deltaproteobacteria bacterium]
MSQTNILLESGTNELEIVEFYLDEPGYRGHYGVNVAKVVEIIRMQPVTAMPQMRHPSVLGAFSHRGGKIVPLVSLARYLNKEQKESDDLKIIVTEFNSIVTGFVVSGVNRIHRLNWHSVEEPGKFLQDISRSSITGVVRLEERVVFILDMENVVADLDPSLAIHFNKIPDDQVHRDKVYTILHADDSGNVRHLVKRLLEDSGQFQVIQTVSGEEAWNVLLKLKANAQNSGVPLQNTIHAVISDIEMPQMDGLTLCRRIKEDSDLKFLPVALFSSLITHSLEHKGRSVGADAQFAKPDLQRLSARLLELIGKTPPPAA